MVNIKFRNMTDEEFDKFVDTSISDYAGDLIKSGDCTAEESKVSAQKQFSQMLPVGKRTKDNYLKTILNSKNVSVGNIWYNKYDENTLFIADFLIFESYRRQGYGKGALNFLTKEGDKLEYQKILLHVFKFNTDAVSLYKSMGYKIVNEDDTGHYMVLDIADGK